MHQLRSYSIIALFLMLGAQVSYASEASSSSKQNLMLVGMSPEGFVKFASETQDPYKILGIPSTFDTERIKFAAQRLRSEYSPQQWPGQEKIAAEASQLINDAQKEAIQQTLVEAVKRGPEYLVKDILKSGADINGRTKQGLTPLIAAATLPSAWGHSVDMVKMLLAAGANPLLEGVWSKNIHGAPRAIVEQVKKELYAWMLRPPQNLDAVACAPIQITTERDRELKNMDKVINLLAAAEENWLAKRMGLPEKAVGVHCKQPVAKRVTGHEPQSQTIPGVMGEKIASYL